MGSDFSDEKNFLQKNDQKMRYWFDIRKGDSLNVCEHLVDGPCHKNFMICPKNVTSGI